MNIWSDRKKKIIRHFIAKNSPNFRQILAIGIMKG